MTSSDRWHAALHCCGERPLGAPAGSCSTMTRVCTRVFRVLHGSRFTTVCSVVIFAELIDEWAQEADPNETLFRLGSSMVDAMAEGVPIEALARYFEYWLLRLQGVYEVDMRLSGEARAFLGAARALSPFALRGVTV